MLKDKNSKIQKNLNQLELTCYPDDYGHKIEITQ